MFALFIPKLHFGRANKGASRASLCCGAHREYFVVMANESKIQGLSARLVSFGAYYAHISIVCYYVLDPNSGAGIATSTFAQIAMFTGQINQTWIIVVSNPNIQSFKLCLIVIEILNSLYFD